MTATYSKEDIESPVNRALASLMLNDRDLLDINVNERSISHQLAVYLAQEFPGWDVDCEYNRDNLDTKRLGLNFGKITEEDIDAKTVYPDIIVHHRRTTENLLVIEMKKSNRNTANDRKKLRAFTGEEYKYRFGLLLLVSGDSTLELIWFQNGREIDRHAVPV